MEGSIDNARLVDITGRQEPTEPTQPETAPPTQAPTEAPTLSPTQGASSLPSPSSPEQGKGDAQTGDNTPWIMVAVLLVLSLAVIIVLVIKPKNKK